MQSAADCCGLSRRNARMPARVFPRDQQRQLERIFEAELRELPCGGQGGDHVLR